MPDDIAALVREVRFLRWFYANAPLDAAERQKLRSEYERQLNQNLFLTRAP
jgi:hypothetical protein